MRPPADGGLLAIINLDSRRTLGTRVRAARTLRSRLVGLLDRSSLGAGEGLWLEPCPSIHMFFMRFAIDAVFVDRAGTVTSLAPNLPPWRMAFGARGSHAVLELPVGVIAASATKVGDRLEIRPRT